MRKLILIILKIIVLLAFFFESIYSADYTGEMKWMRQPASARGTAMGKSGVALVNGSNTVFWNPGGAASLKGINISYTNYHWVNSKYGIHAISFNTRTKKKFNLGLNYYRYYNSMGSDNYYFNTIGIFIGYSFNNISIGINPKIFNLNYKEILTFEKNNILAFDCCVLYSKDINIKAFSFLKNLSFGGSILNISESVRYTENWRSNSYTNIFPFKFSRLLPWLLRIGYSSTFKFLIKNKCLFSVINNLEYLDTVNSSDSDISHKEFFGGGLELSAADFLFARLGYYHNLNGNAPDDGLTYGIGVNVPLKNIIKKMPIEIKYDYSKFPINQETNFYRKIHSVGIYLNY